MDECFLRVRQGGPADQSSLIEPLDRILQIDGTKTNDFDCCLAVPLIAAAEDRIQLVISRSTKAIVTFNAQAFPHLPCKQTTINFTNFS